MMRMLVSMPLLWAAWAATGACQDCAAPPNGLPSPAASTQSGSVRDSGYEVLTAPLQITAAGDRPLTLERFDGARVVAVNTDTLVLQLAAASPSDTTAVLYLDGEPVEAQADAKTLLESQLCRTFAFRIAGRVPPGVYCATVALARNNGVCTALSEPSAPITFRYQPRRGYVQLVRNYRTPPANVTLRVADKRARGDNDVNVQIHVDSAATAEVAATGEIPPSDGGRTAQEDLAVTRDRIARLIESVCREAEVARKEADQEVQLAHQAAESFTTQSADVQKIQSQLLDVMNRLSGATTKIKELTDKKTLLDAAVTDTTAATFNNNNANRPTAINAVTKERDAVAALLSTATTQQTADEALRDQLNEQLKNALQSSKAAEAALAAVKASAAHKAAIAKLAEDLCARLKRELNAKYPTPNSETPAPTEGAHGNPPATMENASAGVLPAAASTSIASRGAGEPWMATRTLGAFERLAKVTPLKADHGDDEPFADDLPLTVHEYRFHSPAHIAWRRFAELGGPLDQTGVVIYEGMQFAAREDGSYQVAFDVQTPAAPVDLRLQLTFQNSGDRRWHTITLPPISLPATIDQLDGPQVMRVVQRGYSSALEMAPLIEDFELRRSGTATIGFGASQYRPQTELPASAGAGLDRAYSLD